MALPAQKFWPSVEDEAGPKVHLALTLAQNAIQQHEDALMSLKSQLDAAVIAQTTVTTTAAAVTTTASTSNLGHVNPQTGTSYTLQDSDYGGIVTLSNASAVAVSLSTNVRQNWFGALENLGAGLVTLTPSSGTINGFASITIATGVGIWAFFDGVNFSAVTNAVYAPTNNPTFTGTVTQPTPSVLTAATTATSATAGTATALPSVPVGYLTVSINGTNRKIPYYAT